MVCPRAAQSVSILIFYQELPAFHSVDQPDLIKNDRGKFWSHFAWESLKDQKII